MSSPKPVYCRRRTPTNCLPLLTLENLHVEAKQAFANGYRPQAMTIQLVDGEVRYQLQIQPSPR